MKYILYKTTNLVNNYFYIGVHKTETPMTFDKYLGNGIYINRPNTYEKAKTALQKAVKEFGVKCFNRVTLAIFDTAEEAYAAEKLIVNDLFLARSDVYNMIKGGIINKVQGQQIHKYSADTGKYIETYNSITDAAKSVNSNGSTISHSVNLRFAVRGFVFDFNKYDIIDLSLYNFKKQQTVYRYTKDGKFDCDFQSLTQAGQNSLETSAIYIQKAAILGYLVKDTYYFSFYKEESFDKARMLQIKNRPVYKYDKNGNYLQSYQTQEKAEKENKFSNITKSIKFKRLDENNFYWSLELLPKYNVPIKHSAKKVAKLDENGNIIQIWNSSNLCAKEVGTAVKNVLRGKYEMHKGFKYKYINN